VIAQQIGNQTAKLRPANHRPCDWQSAHGYSRFATITGEAETAVTEGTGDVTIGFHPADGPTSVPGPGLSGMPRCGRNRRRPTRCRGALTEDGSPLCSASIGKPPSLGRRLDNSDISVVCRLHKYLCVYMEVQGFSNFSSRWNSDYVLSSYLLCTSGDSMCISWLIWLG
jgi:hypothetical protein